MAPWTMAKSSVDAWDVGPVARMVLCACRLQSITASAWAADGAASAASAPAQRMASRLMRLPPDVRVDGGTTSHAATVRATRGRHMGRMTYVSRSGDVFRRYGRRRGRASVTRPRFGRRAPPTSGRGVNRNTSGVYRERRRWRTIVVSRSPRPTRGTHGHLSQLIHGRAVHPGPDGRGRRRPAAHVKPRPSASRSCVTCGSG